MLGFGIEIMYIAYQDEWNAMFNPHYVHIFNTESKICV